MTFNITSKEANNSNMNTRPKPGESEEEILKQQEEFFKLKAASKIKPSVIVEAKQSG